MVIVLMGVSGCGKTTIGKQLSRKTGFPFFEGDEYHSAENVQKMSAGTPLTDKDRIPWIAALTAAVNADTASSQIIACSALTVFIRNLIVEKLESPCRFFHLEGDFKLIEGRMSNREGHYMKSGMLASQFDALEAPDNVVTIDIRHSPEKICEDILKSLN